MNAVLDRLKARIDVTDTCWLWTGALTNGGYGKAKISQRTMLVHRVMYELLVGEIPEGLQLDHTCRVRRCCNPDHLEPVTAKENKRRSPISKTPHGDETHCKRGHPFSGRNLHINARGHRVCRACACENSKKYREKD